MRHFSRILFLLTTTLSCVTLSHAQMFPPAPPPPPAPAPTLTIKDNLAPTQEISGPDYRHPIYRSKHAPLQHWEVFSTTVSASVVNPPQPGTETTLEGPAYQWSGGSDVTSLTSEHGQSIGLQSSLGTELPPGENSVAVRCAATYTEKDSDGHTLRTLPPIETVITIFFWSRVPKIVVQTAERDHTPYTGQSYSFPDKSSPTGYTMLPAYGHRDLYSLQIQDNQNDNLDVKQRSPYGNGLPRETFNVTQGDPDPNGSAGPATWGYHTDGSGSPTDSFVDQITYLEPTLVGGHPGSQDLNEIMSAFEQPWHCMELKPPYTPVVPRTLYIFPHSFSRETKNPQGAESPTGSDFFANVGDTTLNTHSVVNHYGYAIRSYPGSPWLY